MTMAITRLETLAEDILSEIDGGEDLRGRDSQLSAWAADIENIVQLLKQASPYEPVSIFNYEPEKQS